MSYVFFFFFNDTATTEIYTLSLHDALPICLADRRRRERRGGVHRGLRGRDVPGRRDAALSLREGAGRGPGRLRGEPVTARRVVLTGRGVVSPLGVGVDAHWDALCAGRSGVARLDRLAALGLPASPGGAGAPDLVQPHLGRPPRKQQKLYKPGIGRAHG